MGAQKNRLIEAGLLSTHNICFGLEIRKYSNTKCFRRIILFDKRGLVEVIVPFRGYDEHSTNQVMIKRELFSDKVLLISVLMFDKIAVEWMK